ncbi:MAG: alpha/beta fold hydrolase [Deltaproteobacteria bacterium]|nr:alpha/beta fold hydrolase [Deltaproteobacteria bacterium]
MIKIMLHLLLCVPLLCACKGRQELTPEAPAAPPPRTALPQNAVVEEELIYSPAPSGNGQAPEECDYIHYLRYRPASDNDTPVPVKAVVIMIPGYIGGAGSFTYLARQLVALGGDAFPVEVWALDRRSNCLEDQAGMQEAESSEDPQAALDYYYNGVSIDGSTFGGFFTEADTPYLSEFGLQLFMQDIHAILEAKIPDPADRKKTVFIAGHSMGASIAAAYAAWDFDNDSATLDDAGFNNCAGLIGLEGQIAVWSSATNEKRYQKRLSELRAPAQGRSAGFSITPEAMALIEILALYAGFAPHDESTIFRGIAVSPATERLIKFFTTYGLHSAGPCAPALGDFHLSNEAMLGLFSDDNFQPISIGRVSLGFLAGGPVVRRKSLFGGEGLFAPADAGNGAFFTWANFDTTGTADDPSYTDMTGEAVLTTAETEVTDMQDYARAVFEGPLNFYEWYFPGRLPVDLGIVSAPFRARYGIRSDHLAGIDALPKIEFLAENISGYDHIDVLCAAADRPGRRENEVLAPLLDFLKVYSAGTVLIP